MPIMYIIEVAINTSQQNIRQARQIEDSISISEGEIECQSPVVNISNLLLELSFLSLDEF